MKLDTLEMPVEEAKARLAEYEEIVHTERTAEDAAIAAGYRAAARGLPVIELSRVMAAGGWFPSGLPRLAVARADAAEVHVEVTTRWGRDDQLADVVFSDDDTSRNRGALVGKHSVRVGRIPGRDPVSAAWHGRTIVPLIPPRHRPRRHRIRGFHILFEVEAWRPVPSRDPALLRHIRGDLWAVVATWDLTPLEMAVLGARSRS